MYTTMTLDQFAATYASAAEVLANSKNLCMCGKKLGDRNDLSGSFYVTEKLDGVRCIAVCVNGGVALYSRNGNKIAGCAEVRRAILRLGIAGVLDGELIATPWPGESRKETYERTRADLRAGRGEMRFHVFDILTAEEWSERRGTIPYAQRRERLEQIAAELPAGSPLQIVPVLYRGQNLQTAHELMGKVCGQGGEGVMINVSNAVYQFGRCDSLLKLKPVSVADLLIVDVLPGTGRNAGKTGAIVVEYKGNRVGVSSGLSAGLRKAIYDAPEKYIGRVAAIQYGEESCDAAGNPSLRFPVFVEIRELGKQVSYD